MEALKNKAARFANTDFPVLIQGEVERERSCWPRRSIKHPKEKMAPLLRLIVLPWQIHFWKASYLDTRRELSQEPVKKAGLGFLRWQVEELYSWMKSEIFL